MKQLTEIKLFPVTLDRKIIFDYTGRKYKLLSIQTEKSMNEFDLEKAIFEKFGFMVKRSDITFIRSGTFLQKRLFEENYELNVYVFEVKVDYAPPNEKFILHPIKSLNSNIAFWSNSTSNPNRIFDNVAVMVDIYKKFEKAKREFAGKVTINTNLWLWYFFIYSADIEIVKGKNVTDIYFDEEHVPLIERFLKFYLPERKIITLSFKGDVVFYYKEDGKLLKVVLSEYNEEEMLTLISRLTDIWYKNIRLYFLYNSIAHIKYMPKKEDLSPEVFDFIIQNYNWYYLYLVFTNGISAGKEVDQLPLRLGQICLVGDYLKEVDNEGHEAYFTSELGEFVDRTFAACIDFKLEPLRILLLWAINTLNSESTIEETREHFQKMDDDYLKIDFTAINEKMTEYIRTNKELIKKELELIKKTN